MAFNIDDRLVEVARKAYSIARGSEIFPPPDHLALSWDELPDDVRALYVALVRAGYEENRDRP